MGTRGSALALAQSSLVARELARLSPGLEIETAVIKTSGDLFAAQAPQNVHALTQGAKGLFVKEIEEALREGRIDFAVHSAKDLPASLAEGLTIAAYPEREDPRDVFIGRDGIGWSGVGKGARLGTSSLRRKVQLLKARPDLEIMAMRGNVDTRLRRLREGACEGLVLAAAGLRRLGRTDVPAEPLPTEVVLPAPGQGALAVEARQDRPELLALLGGLDHPATRLEVECERSFLAELGGGCSTPLGALARAQGPGLALTVFWSDPEGLRPLRLSASAEASGGETLARSLAERIRAHP